MSKDSPLTIRVVYTYYRFSLPILQIKIRCLILHNSGTCYFNSISEYSANIFHILFTLQKRFINYYKLTFADIISESPTLSVDQENSYLNDVVTFNCDKGTVKGNPAVSTVSWYKDHHPTNWSRTSFIIKRKVTLEDSGLYKCLVGNIIGFSGFSNTVHLKVSRVPSKYQTSMKSSKETRLQIRHLPCIKTQ